MNFKQNSFETEVNCPEKALNFTTEPLQGSMMVYSGHCPHTKCLRHFSVGLTTNRSLRDLAPMCLRHNGAPRLMSHNSVYCSDQASSLRSFVFAWLWLRRAKGSYDSMLSEPAGSVKAMHECSTVCGLDVSRPSLSKARYKDSLDYHRVRSLRDLAPRCLRHFSVGFGLSLCRQRAPALCADEH